MLVLLVRVKNEVFGGFKKLYAIFENGEFKGMTHNFLCKDPSNDDSI